MSTPVLICDDSSFARKQMARALPRDWDIEITFAEHGGQALEAIAAGRADILFLDLNMPVMDGYEVLEAIRARDLPTLVIVVSGDIQPEAYERVRKLGALDFIRKPIDEAALAELLDRYGIRSHGDTRRTEIEVEVELLDIYREIANVAMGRAADRLARLLEVFIQLPVPRVSLIEGNDLRMAFQQVAGDDTVSSVCQGFIGAGIAGEAMLTFTDSSLSDIGELMRYEGEIDQAVELELIMDIANVLIGACLNGIAEQLDISFSQGHPLVLGRHVGIDELLRRNASRWDRLLAIEIDYRIENRDINCDLMLLFTEDSLEPLSQLAAFIEA